MLTPSLTPDYEDIGQYYCQGKNYVADGEERTAQELYNLNTEVKHTVSVSTGYVIYVCQYFSFIKCISYSGLSNNYVNQLMNKTMKI